MRQMLTILFKISRVNFFPDPQYMNDHAGDYVVITYLLMAVDNTFLGKIASGSGIAVSYFYRKKS